jgi:hypothetical protein
MPDPEVEMDTIVNMSNEEISIMLRAVRINAARIRVHYADEPEMEWEPWNAVLPQPFPEDVESEFVDWEGDVIAPPVPSGTLSGTAPSRFSTRAQRLARTRVRAARPNRDEEYIRYQINCERTRTVMPRARQNLWRRNPNSEAYTTLSLYLANFAQYNRTPETFGGSYYQRTRSVMTTRIPLPANMCEDCEDTEAAPDSNLCTDCGVECHRCHEFVYECDTAQVTTWETVRTYNGPRQTWCEACADRHAEFCSICDRSHTIDTNYCNGCGESHCYRCADYECGDCGELFCSEESRDECCESSSYRDRGGYLHSYGYRPSPAFHHVKEGNPVVFGGEHSYNLTDDEREASKPDNIRTAFFGVELEVGVDTEVADQIHRDFGKLLYCKEDSSVDGFEMVTHPMSFDFAMNHFPYEIFERMRDSGGDAGPNGLHIHVSRATFEDADHMSRFNWLVNVNKDMWVHISRRDSEEWARFERLDQWQERPWVDNSWAPRYSALNYLNHATIECRTFASTLDEAEFKACIALMSAAVEYTRVNDCLSAIAYEEFAGWVFAQEQYAEVLGPFLYDYTVNRVLAAV